MLRDWTCLTWELDMSGQSLCNLARGPDKSGLTRGFSGRIDF
jgi:hypothetical protein